MAPNAPEGELAVLPLVPLAMGALWPGIAMPEVPVVPITPVCGTPGDAVAAPAGRLLVGCGALLEALGAGGLWLAPDWAMAGAAKASEAAKRPNTNFMNVIPVLDCRGNEPAVGKFGRRGVTVWVWPPASLLP